MQVVALSTALSQVVSTSCNKSTNDKLQQFYQACCNLMKLTSSLQLVQQVANKAVKLTTCNKLLQQAAASHANASWYRLVVNRLVFGCVVHVRIQISVNDVLESKANSWILSATKYGHVWTNQHLCIFKFPQHVSLKPWFLLRLKWKEIFTVTGQLNEEKISKLYDFLYGSEGDLLQNSAHSPQVSTITHPYLPLTNPHSPFTQRYYIYPTVPLLYTRKNAQDVTNLQASCNKSAIKPLQDLFALLILSCCNKLLTSCYQFVTRLMTIADLLQVCSNKSDIVWT